MDGRWGGAERQPLTGTGQTDIDYPHPIQRLLPQLLCPHPRPQARDSSNSSQALPSTAHLIQVTLRHSPKTHGSPLPMDHAHKDLAPPGGLAGCKCVSYPEE